MIRFLKSISFQLFKFAAKFGIYILPAHYYIPLADINQLESSKETWAKKSGLPGISSNLDEQISNLQKICQPYQKESIGNETYLTAINEHFGPGYGYIEAQVLHGFIRHYQPKMIIEVGSGVSTYCMLEATKINKKMGEDKTNIICIEPFPSQQISSLKNVELVKEQVQSVSVEKFQELRSGDFLFIDSTHTVKPGSDVNYLILEVLPRLSKGVLIHFHDIFLPYDYPRNVLNSYFHWMETSLLRAFLINNHKVKILFCLSHLHYDRQKELKKIFPDYKPAKDINGLELNSGNDSSQDHFPASIYLEIL